MKMIYTAIIRDRNDNITRKDFVSSHDSRSAWSSATEMFKGSDSFLIALIPGNHEIVTSEGRIKYHDQDH